MKLGRCPTCHGHLNLDTLIQDSSAKSLLSAVAKLPPKLATNLIGYIALWRPEKSDLNNDRAVKLINEVLELSNNKPALNMALEQTTLSIRAKRQSGTYQPFKNHSYLNQVIKSMEEKYPMASTATVKQKESNIHIKAQGVELTLEQKQAAHAATMAKYTRSNK